MADIDEFGAGYVNIAGEVEVLSGEEIKEEARKRGGLVTTQKYEVAEQMEPYEK